MFWSVGRASWICVMMRCVSLYKFLSACSTICEYGCFVLVLSLVFIESALHVYWKDICFLFAEEVSTLSMDVVTGGWGHMSPTQFEFLGDIPQKS